jgi:hypothetical protein
MLAMAVSNNSASLPCPDVNSDDLGLDFTSSATTKYKKTKQTKRNVYSQHQAMNNSRFTEKKTEAEIILIHVLHGYAC